MSLRMGSGHDDCGVHICTHVYTVWVSRTVHMLGYNDVHGNNIRLGQHWLQCNATLTFVWSRYYKYILARSVKHHVGCMQSAAFGMGVHILKLCYNVGAWEWWYHCSCLRMQVKWNDAWYLEQGWIAQDIVNGPHGTSHIHRRDARLCRCVINSSTYTHSCSGLESMSWYSFELASSAAQM